MLIKADLLEADIMKSLAVVSMLLALASYSASASPLYQWTGPDGTPTFSPDPPPKGVKYTIVGPDLQPLANQPALTPTATATAATPAKPSPASTAPAKAGSIVLTPAPQSAQQATSQTNEQPTIKKPATQWKPVKYADDPNPNADKPVFTTRTQATATVTPMTRVSDECLRLKQQQLILESQFAGARTAEDMDSAILKLNAFNKQNKGNCGY